LKQENKLDYWTKWIWKNSFAKSLLEYILEIRTNMFDGRVYSELEPDEKEKLRTEIGMVFQGSAYLTLTVAENVGFL
jgi:phospholipid/cholesterol/gamma-HCH transport system ATP-binding protein